MRGDDTKQGTMLSLVTPEKRVPADHPLRQIKTLAEEALRTLSPVFDEMYSSVGRPSIPPERLLKATLLMALYTVRSERMLCEQVEYNLLFRWFLDMNMDEATFDPTTFTKNRQRLLEHDVARRFFEAVVAQADKAGLMSREHFTVDGTPIEAWASLKSIRRKNEKPGDRPPPDDLGNPSVNFRGEKRSNTTHESTMDPEARWLARRARNLDVVLAARADGEPERADRQRAHRRSDGKGRSDQRAADARRAAGAIEPPHDRRRQGLRHEGIRGLDARHERHASRRQERVSRAIVDARRSDHQTHRLRRQPTNSKTCPGDLRLDEDRREFQANAIQGSGADSTGITLCRSRLQPAPNVAADTEDGMTEVPSGSGRPAKPARSCGTPARATALTLLEADFSAPG